MNEQPVSSLSYEVLDEELSEYAKLVWGKTPDNSAIFRRFRELIAEYRRRQVVQVPK